jgi:UDP-N-acetylglucosamine--N-acetylmuramyl-(pentapeptide) pyrophosphoryl-undecaprenol N-acetylglucosamine transferase
LDATAAFMPSCDGVNAVFAGGGTGGHLYPAIAVADALRGRQACVTFVGTADRLEATIVPKAGYALCTIASRPLTRGFSFEFALTLAANTGGVLQSLAVLMRLRPDVVIATGGYVCFPVVLAARILRLFRAFRGPIALLEPNAQPGLTNRLLAPLVDEVWGAFADADPTFAGKYVHTGVPVRAALRALPSRENAASALGLDPARKTLLAMGGSQGARSINDALIALVRDRGLPPEWQLLHVAGDADYERARAAIGNGGVVLPYLHDPSEAYAAADLVLARAGASTLAELAAVGKPAILVPYPFASEKHQMTNARRFAATGAALIVEDSGLNDRLRAMLVETTAPRRLETMTTAAERLRGDDPVATILGRVDALIARRSER